SATGTGSVPIAAKHMSKGWTRHGYDPAMPRSWRLVPRIRIVSGEEIAFGPGKADLLEAIARTGKIRDAAESLDMSYMRAWKLIRTMNEAFREPVVEASRGGSARGGATLTDLGRRVLELYRAMEKKAARSASREWNEMKRLLR
ncbi:MAG: winged helix-turn-helix domain-containing protein, partial [Bdellovibrionota bacterium]